MTLRLALSQAPERVEGRSKQKSVILRFCNPCIVFSQALEHVEGGGLCDMREEKIVLDT
jgi:hypothetical protein